MGVQWLTRSKGSCKIESVIANPQGKPYFTEQYHWSHIPPYRHVQSLSCSHGQAQVKEAATRRHLHLVWLVSTTVQEKDKLLRFSSFVVHYYLHRRGLFDRVFFCTTAAQHRRVDRVFNNNANENHKPPAGDDRRTGKLTKLANFLPVYFAV